MEKKDCFYLGKVTKPFGFKGELVLFLDVDNPNNYAHLDSVFIEVGGQLIPYFIKNIRLKENKATVTFEDVDLEHSQRLIGKNLFLPLNLLPQLTGNQFYFHEIIGFSVVDHEKGNVGIIESVLDFPAQPLFQIKSGNKEILLPIIDNVIEKVDREAKTIFVKSPEGLIDLYLA